MGDVSIDLGSLVPYLVESALNLFGRDAESETWKNKIRELVKLSAQQASMVQCVGMPEPIPISAIYQKTTLLTGSGTPVDFRSLLENQQSAICFAGPGWGKTTFLHWTYFNLCKSQLYVPFLFTLRWATAVEDIREFVQRLQEGRQVAGKKRTRLVLLIDGYDEINEEQRQKVSQSLMLFSSLDVGSFYLTCRSHYHVYEIKCRHLGIGAFNRTDALGFIEAYSTAYGSRVDGQLLLRELDEHGLGEFYRHPLMLTLVCILKTGPNQQIPRRSIGLLRRAIDTLTFRWDEAKMVHRPSTIPLDGEERVRCLMRIAFDMDTPQEYWELVRSSAADYLKLIQVKGIDVRQLLEEMARFYGILIPVGEDNWQFVHRTIHDYLSARYWVESGKFDPFKVGTWDMHAVYAACLTGDATEAMLQMLECPELTSLVECLYNGAPFQPEVIAQGIISRTAGVKVASDFKTQPAIARTWLDEGQYSIETTEGLYAVCTNEFLRTLVVQAAGVRSWGDRYSMLDLVRGAQAVATCAIGELYSRGAKIRKRYISLLEGIFAPDHPTSFICSVGETSLSFTLAALERASVP